MEVTNFPHKPYVVIVSGSVGSGKSTITAALSRALENAPVLIFDHYGESIEWSKDIEKWRREGYSPKEIRIPEMKEDLVRLQNGEKIRNPQGEEIRPGRYIVVEEPSGRERDELRADVDFVVFIDTPQDVCVVRMIERLLEKQGWNATGSTVKQSSGELAKQLEEIALWIEQYKRGREMYISVSERAKNGADLVVDGTESVKEITARIVKEVREKSG